MSRPLRELVASWAERGIGIRARAADVTDVTKAMLRLGALGLMVVLLVILLVAACGGDSDDPYAGVELPKEAAAVRAEPGESSYDFEGLGWCFVGAGNVHDWKPGDAGGFVGNLSLASLAYENGFGAFSSAFAYPGRYEDDETSFYGFRTHSDAVQALDDLEEEAATSRIVGNVVVLNLPDDVAYAEQSFMDDCFNENPA